MEGRDAMSHTARSAVKLTYDDLVAMFPDEDGIRRELIGGELFVTPSPFIPHQRLVLRLALSLGSHLDIHPDQGEVFIAPLDVILTAHDVVEPDLLVVRGNQQDILTEKHVRGAPAIVIEVLSQGTRKRDETLKRNLFDREGVQEYWLVDPKRSQIAIYRRSGGSFTQAIILFAGTGEMLTTDLLPGWSLSVDQLFR
jgi:Uma2 family endonuclease